MAELFGVETGLSVPSLGIGGSGIWWYLIIFILLLVVGGVVIFIMNRLLVYRYKIVVFENISGQGYRIGFKDKARLVKLGDGGEEILYLMKKKVYRSAYGRKMGKNQYWFAIGQDGYWYNIILGDVDAKMGMLDIEPIDRDMRYMHVAIRKNIDYNYGQKQSFLEKYAVHLMLGFFFIMMLIGMWFLLDKGADLITALTDSANTNTRASEKITEAITHIDNLLGNSGIKEAGVG